MHHERDLSDEMMAASLQKKLGATGRFPGGQLTRNDEGEILFAVGHLKGKVIVNFGSPVASLGMTLKEARELALSLRQWANKIERDQVKSN